jgi:hypothetical protein
VNALVTLALNRARRRAHWRPTKWFDAVTTAARLVRLLNADDGELPVHAVRFEFDLVAGLDRLEHRQPVPARRPGVSTAALRRRWARSEGGASSLEVTSSTVARHIHRRTDALYARYVLPNFRSR